MSAMLSTAVQDFMESIMAKIKKLRHPSRPTSREGSPDPAPLAQNASPMNSVTSIEAINDTPDTFNTMDIHPPDQPQLKNEKVFSVSPHPAGYPIGLTWLDIDKRANIRINAFVEPFTDDSVKVHLDASADTVLYSAGCTWLEVYAKDRDFQFGTFSTLDDHPYNKPRVATSRKITFTRPFHGKPPKVIVWLNELHISNKANWRCKAYATHIACDGFVI